jgi:hypothetical protein
LVREVNQMASGGEGKAHVRGILGECGTELEKFEYI